MTLDLSAATRAVRAGIASDREHGAVVPPIHLTSTFAFERFGQPRAFDYTRSGNPTRSHLAGAIAELEGGQTAVVTNTGMSAVALVLQLARPGDLVLAAHDSYGGTQRLLRALAARNHCEVEFADLTKDADALLARARRPRMVWVETPSNPLLRITDIRKVAAAARAANALTVVDNTFLSPALQRPLELGADIVVHSTTKYLNGHSDVVGGAVVARDAAVGEELAWWANCLGVTGAPFDSFLTLRGIRTLFPRMAQHQSNAAAVVDALARHPAVARVHYPGLAGHAGHDVARAQQSGFGAMVSFELAGGAAAVPEFTRALQCFTLAESLGGVESLVAHPATMTHASMPPEARAAAGISDALVRLSVGIEDSGDLVRDLVTALDAVVQPVRPRAQLAPRLREGTPPVIRQTSDRARRARSDVVLLGAGAIGRELLRQLGMHGGAFRVCAVVDRSGYVFDRDGMGLDSLRAICEFKAGGGRLADASSGVTGTSAESLDAITGAELWRPIVVDVTPADTTNLLECALARGADVVLANKVPLVGDLSAVARLHHVARLHGRRMLHEATVGAGLPIIDTIRKLRESGDTIHHIEGCPSGTLGFLFGELGRGRPFSQALRAAIAAGYTEPDPRIDLSGVDVARKALILARSIGFAGDLGDVVVESLVPPALESLPLAAFLPRVEELDEYWAGRAHDAQARDAVLRYRARATGTSAVVGLVEVSRGDPLGTLDGTDNQFAFTTERYHDRPLIIRGPGAGPAVTAAGVFNDLLRIAAERNSREVITRAMSS